MISSWRISSNARRDPKRQVTIGMMNSKLSGLYVPSPDELEQLFQEKYGSPEDVGWSPRRRFGFSYYLPSHFYDASVEKNVFERCAWIDAGGGRAIFPENPRLAERLADRCSHVVAIDSSDNVYENKTVHQRGWCSFEDYRPECQFDLATMRMLAEYVAKPERT